MRVEVEFKDGSRSEMFGVLVLWIEDGRLHTDRGSWPLANVARLDAFRASEPKARRASPAVLAEVEEVLGGC